MAATFTNQDVRGKPLMEFLPLAPLTSETTSQPTQQSAQQPTPRRSSSLSSTGSIISAQRLRFLKLGPVQNGEHPDENKDDFHEVAVIE